MVTSSALQKRAALLTTTSSTGWSSVGEVLMIFKTSAAAFCCSSASFNSRVSRVTLVSWPPSEELLRAAGAVRRFDTSALRRRALVGLLLALERRRIAYPKARDKAL